MAMKLRGAELYSGQGTVQYSDQILYCDIFIDVHYLYLILNYFEFITRFSCISDHFGIASQS